MDFVYNKKNLKITSLKSGIVSNYLDTKNDNGHNFTKTSQMFHAFFKK
ncbi:hypothetical protein RIVM261_055520 [Rivularia sp. IAM M-261]|nr:hypothetical protein CAL7716_009250 [Calothrix sp. PCC 7716]GJD20596.1 hypothetical protein RIVM261_055520 [Rivularia sp. IAM M-261]